MATTTTTKTTTTAPKPSSTEEFFMQRVIELDTEIKRLDAGMARAQATIATNTDTRNTLVMERLRINPMYYPAGSTEPTIGKRSRMPRERTSVRETRIFTVIDGIKERGTASVGVAVFGVILGFIIGLIAGCIVQQIIVTWITWLNPALPLFWLALVMAGAGFGYFLATKPKDLVSPVH